MRILSFEGGSSRSHYVESLLWTCRKTDYYTNDRYNDDINPAMSTVQNVN